MADDIYVRSETGSTYIRHGNVRAKLEEGELLSRLEVLSKGDWKVVDRSPSNDALIGMAEGLKGDLAQVIARMEGEVDRTVPKIEAGDIAKLLDSPADNPAIIVEDGQIEVRSSVTAYDGDIIVRGNELPQLMDPDGVFDWGDFSEEDAELVADLLNRSHR